MFWRRVRLLHGLRRLPSPTSGRSSCWPWRARRSHSRRDADILSLFARSQIRRHHFAKAIQPPTSYRRRASQATAHSSMRSSAILELRRPNSGVVGYLVMYSRACLSRRFLVVSCFVSLHGPMVPAGRPPEVGTACAVFAAEQSYFTERLAKRASVREIYHAPI